MVVVRQPGSDRGTGGFPHVMEGLPWIVAQDELEAVLGELRAMQTAGDRVDLAVIGPDVAHPLSAGRELRRLDSSIGLVFVTPPEAAESLELRVSLVPELRGGSVVPVDAGAEAITERVQEAAESAVRQRRLSDAIDGMNRQLMRATEEPASPTPQRVASDSHLAELVRHLPEAVLSFDQNGSIISVNEAAVELLGLPAEALRRATLHDVSSRNARLEELVRQALAGETSIGEVLRLVGADEELTTAVTAAPVRDRGGDVIGAVLVVRDVTSERQAADRLRQLQKAESLATLAGGVAHDFNNLLVTVRSWAQIAAEDPDDSETLGLALERIEDAAGRAADLARSMLVYGGRGRFELEPVSTAEVMRGMEALLRGAINENIELDLDLDPEVPPVRADTTQLRQVVMNLVTNAAEAIGDRPGTITMRTHEVASPAWIEDPATVEAERVVVIEVTDTGPGMDQETLERIFDPFFTTKFEGRGLGLAATQGIVQAHGGAIVATSTPGRGATFRVALPVVEQ